MSFNEDIRNRTKKFALRVIKLFQALPKTTESQIIGKQLLRASTSIAANFRAASRARSNQEFHAKICIAVEEADEVVFWLEMLEESGNLLKTKLNGINTEALEILKILSSTRKKSRDKLKFQN